MMPDIDRNEPYRALLEEAYNNGTSGLLVWSLFAHGNDVEKYAGPDDLSGDFWTKWDDDYLYFAARIQDDVFSQEKSGLDMWMGDSVQVAFSSGLPGTNSEFYEFGLALSKTGSDAREPQLVMWRTAAPQLEIGLVTDPDVKLQVTRDEETKQTVYELALPWSAVPTIDKHSVFSYSVAVNENDGGGRDGWMEWGGGVGGQKNVAAFLPAQLVSDAAAVITSPKGRLTSPPKTVTGTIQSPDGGGAVSKVEVAIVRNSDNQYLNVTEKKFQASSVYNEAEIGDSGAWKLDLSGIVLENGEYTVIALACDGSYGIPNTSSFTITVEADTDEPAGSTGGSISSDPKPSETVVPEPGEGPSAIIAAAPVMDTATREAVAAVTPAMIDEAFSQASADAASGVQIVQITVPAVEGAAAYELKLPAAAFASGASNRMIRVETEFGKLDVPLNMLGADQVAGAGNVSFCIAKVEPASVDAALREDRGQTDRRDPCESGRHRQRMEQSRSIRFRLDPVYAFGG
jgi:hypothetical protein